MRRDHPPGLVPALRGQGPVLHPAEGAGRARDPRHAAAPRAEAGADHRRLQLPCTKKARMVFARSC